MKLLTITKGKFVLAFVISMLVWGGCASTKSFLQAPLQKLEHPVWGRALVGISVYDLDKNKSVFAYQENRRFIPASNTKLLTTFAALKYLPDSIPGWFFRFEGDTVFLRPNGDPTTFHPSFDQNKLLQFLRTQAQARKTLVLLWQENADFTTLGMGWPWSALKESSYIERSELPIFAYKHPAQRPAAGLARTTPLNVELFRDTLNVLMPHMRLEWKQLEQVPNLTDFYPIFTQAKDTLLARMMKPSDNFLAEQLVLMVGTQIHGRLSDRETMNHVLKTDLKNFPDSPIWVDGSGLSRYNHFSPRFFVHLLRKLEGDYGWDRMTQLLPHGGEGTLKGLYESYSDRIFAKTGTLSSSVALSGYLLTKKGRRLAFSILLNNHESSSADSRKAIETYLTQLIEKY